MQTYINTRKDTFIHPASSPDAMVDSVKLIIRFTAALHTNTTTSQFFATLLGNWAETAATVVMPMIHIIPEKIIEPEHKLSLKMLTHESFQDEQLQILFLHPWKEWSNLETP